MLTFYYVVVPRLVLLLIGIAICAYALRPYTSSGTYSQNYQFFRENKNGPIESGLKTFYFMNLKGNVLVEPLFTLIRKH